MPEPLSNHVVTTDGGATKCIHCGEVLRFVLPMAVSVWVAASRAFIRLHRACKAKEEKPHA